jgi:hypothetical protein
MARIMIPKDRLDAIDAVAIQALVDAGALESRTPLLHWGSVQPAGIGLRVWERRLHVAHPADGYLAVFVPPAGLPPIESIQPCQQ